MYAIFFTPYATTVQVAVPKGRSVTGLTYKICILKKVRKHFVKRRPKTGLKGVKLLYDNAPCHKSKVMTGFLNKEKVKVLPHPLYSLDLSPCDFFLFPRLKITFSCTSLWFPACLGLWDLSVSFEYTTK